MYRTRGKFDKAVVRYFGGHIQARIQERILADYLGEQPVGTSIIVSTGMPAHAFVAHTPTMRIPMNISVIGAGDQRSSR